MRILIISRGFPSKDEPQWGNFEKDQADALLKKGHSIVMMSIDRRFRKKKWFSVKVRTIDGITSYNLNLPSLFNERLIFTLPILRYIGLLLYKRIIHDGFVPDVIYSHYLNNSVLSLDIKRRYNIPVVAIEHWSKVNQPVLPLYVKLMGKSVYNKVDCILSVSNAINNQIKHHFNRSSIVVHNMVSSHISYVNRADTPPFTFVSVGRLVASKGWEILINAFKKLNNDCQLLIAGDGVERKNIENLISNLNLTDRILLLGNVNKNEFKNIFSRSDCFVLASKSETFGLVYAEAMMAGLPVVATRCGGPEEFVNDENGLLVNVDDIDGFATAMEYMMENISNFDRKSIAAKCRERFSSDIVAEHLIQCFNSVISNNIQ